MTRINRLVLLSLFAALAIPAVVIAGVGLAQATADEPIKTPAIAKPVISDGVEYLAVHDRYEEKGRPRGIRAFVEARDTKTKKSFWRVQVYDIRYRGDLETDVQDVYITDLKLDKSGLIATDERGQRFLINPKTPAGAIVAGLSAQLNNVTVGTNNSIALDFVLLDHSDADIVLAERWNSWGAYQWTFRVVDANGAKFMLGNPQMHWYANFFTTFSIPPSKSQVTKCRLNLASSAFQDGPIAIFSQWEGPLTPRTNNRPNSWVFPLSITGTFSAPKVIVGYGEDVGSNWAGTITTATVQIEKAPRPVVLEQTKSPADRGTPVVATETAPKGQPVPDKTVQLPEPDGEVFTAGLMSDEEGWILLAPLVQKGRDCQDAGWTWDGQTASFGAGKPRGRVVIPVRIAGSYELQTRVTIVRAKEVTAIHLPITGARVVVLEMRGDRGNTESPTATISLRGLKAGAQPEGNVSMKIGTEYALTCKIIRAGDKVAIEIRRDGQILFRWAGYVSQVAEQRVARPGTVQLETAYYTASRFTDLRFRMLSGEAAPLFSE